MANYIFPNLPPKGSKLYVNDTITFEFTGSEQESSFEYLPYKKVKIECWGAAGNMAGGYCWGIFNFSNQPKVANLYYIVGEKGYFKQGPEELYKKANYNITYGGGGEGDNDISGGGASDVRTYLDPSSMESVAPQRLENPNINKDQGTTDPTSLNSRIIVAGGGGGKDHSGGNTGNGSVGGGFENWTNRRTITVYAMPTAQGVTFYSNPTCGGDGNQTSGGGPGSGLETRGYDAMFGVGACGYNATGGGGGGLYGGGRGDGGGGGSSYVSGIAPCVFQTSSGIKADSGGTTPGVNNDNGKIVITILEEIVIGGGSTGGTQPPTSTAKISEFDQKKLYYLKNGETTPKYAIAFLQKELDTGKKPILPYNEDIDGPRNMALKPNGDTYTIWGLSEAPNQSITDEINNTPTQTEMSNVNSNTTVSTDRLTPNSSSIYHVGRYKSIDGSGNIKYTGQISGSGYAFFLHVSEIQNLPTAINNDIKYECHFKCKIRYYWNGGGHWARLTSPSPDGIGRKGTLFCIMGDDQTVTGNKQAGYTVYTYSRHGYALGKILTPMATPAVTYPPTNDDTLTEINSAKVPCATYNSDKMNFDPTPGINKVSHWGQDPANWGRIFTIDCHIPIEPSSFKKYIIVGGFMGFWGTNGDAGKAKVPAISGMWYPGYKGNLAQWFKVESATLEYSAGWSDEANAIANKVGTFIESPDVGKNLSALSYQKSNSSKSYRLFTDIVQGGGCRPIDPSNLGIIYTKKLDEYVYNGSHNGATNRNYLEEMAKNNPGKIPIGDFGGFDSTCRAVYIPQDGVLVWWASDTTIYKNTGINFPNSYSDGGGFIIFNTTYFKATQYKTTKQRGVEVNSLSGLSPDCIIPVKKGEIWACYMGDDQNYFSGRGFSLFV